ncbi:hypothetical protein ACIRP0_21165 [Streptomyces sp. NPDC101733]|uniref:hypothetical protein n=1 Tax=unclassified Streptomyces TaxID=2593676 RepID=UPI003822CE7C
MWPGQQQPPGGEQPNPQDAHQNPYQQQPGQPNPYQQQPPQGFGEQPGYGYPQPGYQTPPPVQPWGQAQPTPPPPGGGSPFSTRTVAIVAVCAVVVTAAATAGFVLTRDDKTNDRADDKPAASSSAPVSPSAPAPAAPSGNPRSGGDVKPVIPGWKVVLNPKYGTAFDIPQEWEALGSGYISGIEDESKNDGSPLISFSSPAYLKQDWCKVDSDKNGSEESTALAASGTKGGQGATDTASASRNEAGNWVFAAYAQKAPKGTVKLSEPKEYTTSSGLKGHVTTATVSGQPKANKCSSDGKSIAFSFKTTNGDFSSWVLYGAANVPGEVDQATYEKILSSVRLTTG